MRGRLNKILLILLIAFCIGSFINYIFFSYPGFTNRFNNLVYDTWLKLKKPQPPHPAPVIIDIDEASLKEIGQLPWPRSILAELVTTLLAMDVSAIGLDVWLSEPDRSSPVAVSSLLEKTFDLTLDLTDLSPEAQDNDRNFRNTILNKPVIIGALAQFDEKGVIPQELPPSLNFIEKTTPGAEFPHTSVQEMTGFEPPLPAFISAAPVAILNIPLDEDGIVRKMPLLVRVDEQLFPGLALRTLMTAMKQNELYLESSAAGLESIKLGDLVIPVESDGAFRPLYRGAGYTFPHYSAKDVLAGKIPFSELKGRIAFIGPSAHTLPTLRSIPFDRAIASAEIHATLVDNFLTNTSIAIPHNSRLIQICLSYSSALVSATAFLLLTLPFYALIAVLLTIFYIGGSWLLFQNGIFLSPTGSVLALLLAGILIIPSRYWLEQKERRKLKQAFNQYVSPEVVSRILTAGEELLKGEQIEATIMFTDVRNFTNISEKLAPTDLVRLLNFYFTPMTACVTARKGTLDKFIGDSLMAFWNAPINVENHPLYATLAALDMQKALAGMRPEIQREFKINLHMGIGIHTGSVHVGNMGSTDLLDYTCIGETVNLTSRLEGMCKRYGMEIIVSESVKNACGSDLEFLLLDKIRVKGSSKPLLIYTPLAIWEHYSPEAITQWHAALHLYFEGDFENAYSAFSSLANYPLLQGACKLFMNRCADFMANPPQEWNGVWNYLEK